MNDHDALTKIMLEVLAFVLALMFLILLTVIHTPS